MVTTKTTSHKFTTPGGSEIVCTVTRTYGSKHVEEHEETAWLDQPVTIRRPAGEEFVDEYKITVSVNGEDKGEFRHGYGFGRKYNDGKVIDEGYNGLECCNGRQRIIIPLGAEDDKIIRDLIHERLNDDLSPSDVEDIETVKGHMATNAILPKAELEARRKEYQAGMLEGGEGFNPYSYYITREFADRVIRQFPQYFK